MVTIDSQNPKANKFLLIISTHSEIVNKINRGCENTALVYSLNNTTMYYFIHVDSSKRTRPTFAEQMFKTITPKQRHSCSTCIAVLNQAPTRHQRKECSMHPFFRQIIKTPVPVNMLIANQIERRGSRRGGGACPPPPPTGSELFYYPMK